MVDSVIISELQLQENIIKSESDIYLIISSDVGEDRVCDEDLKILYDRRNSCIVNKDLNNECKGKDSYDVKVERETVNIGTSRSEDRGNKICIVCTSPYNLRSITESYPYLGSQHNENYYTMLDNCFGIKFTVIKNDRADAICMMCKGRLRQCLEFKRDVELAYERFNLYSKGYSTLKRTTTNTPAQSNIVAPRSFKIHRSSSLVTNNHKEKSNLIKKESPNTAKLFVKKPTANVKVSTDKHNTTEILPVKKRSVTKRKNIDADRWSVSSGEMDKATRQPEMDDKKQNCGPKQQTICHICGKLYSQISHHMETHDNKQYSCKICDKAYTLKSTLQQHTRSVHNKCRLYPCSVCNVRLRYYREMRLHQQTEHGIEYPTYNCDQCSRRFFTMKSVLKHVQQSHLKTLSFFCDICNRGFRIKAHLKNHLTKHLGKKDHNCEFCGGLFKYRKSLLSHMRLKHNYGVTMNVNKPK